MSDAIRGPGRLRRAIPWAVGGLAGLVIGAAAGGSGDSGTKTVTEAGDVTTQTVSHTVTVHAKPSRAAVDRAVARRERASEQAHEQRAARQQEKAAAATKSFSGNGGKKLPPFTIDQGSTLHWTNSGDIFQVFDIDNGVTINSQAKSGDTYLDPGTYTLDVNALGDWTIRVTPGS